MVDLKTVLVHDAHFVEDVLPVLLLDAVSCLHVEGAPPLHHLEHLKHAMHRGKNNEENPFESQI